MISEDNVKKRFIVNTLENYGKHAVKSQKKRIRQSGMEKYTGDMLDTIKKTVIERSGANADLTFELRTHQRWQDMRLRSKIYNNIFTWYYHKIAERLQWGYTEEIKETIQKELADKK